MSASPTPVWMMENVWMELTSSRVRVNLDGLEHDVKLKVCLKLCKILSQIFEQSFEFWVFWVLSQFEFWDKFWVKTSFRNFMANKKQNQ